MKSAAALMLIALTAACRVERTERPPLADPGAAARVGIEVALGEFETALAAGDARRATSYFTPDGSLILRGGREYAGRGEIAVGLGQALLADSSPLDLNTDVIDVSSGVAWQSGTFERQPVDSADAPVSGRFAIRWVRGPDATWRMHRALLADLPPDTSAVPADGSAPE